MIEPKDEVPKISALRQLKEAGGILTFATPIGPYVMGRLSKHFTKAVNGPSVDWGRQKPVVFMYQGLGEARSAMRPLGDMLEAAGVEVVYAGPSWNAGTRLSGAFEGWVDKFAEQVKPYEWRPVFLCGHSLGAVIAAAIAKRFPDRINGTINLAAPMGMIPVEKRQNLSFIARAYFALHPNDPELMDTKYCRNLYDSIGREVPTLAVSFEKDGLAQPRICEKPDLIESDLYEQHNIDAGHYRALFRPSAVIEMLLPFMQKNLNDQRAREPCSKRKANLEPLC